MAPVREEKVVVSGVATLINLLIMRAGDAFAFNSAELSEAGKQQLVDALEMYKAV